MIKGLELLFLEVNNLEESVTFYHQTLGLEIESHQAEAEPPIATLRAGSLRINLVQQVETMLKRGRGVHFVFGLADVDGFYDRLATAGGEITAHGDAGWGGGFVSLQVRHGYRLFFVAWERPPDRAR